MKKINLILQDTLTELIDVQYIESKKVMFFSTNH